MFRGPHCQKPKGPGARPPQHEYMYTSHNTQPHFQVSLNYYLAKVVYFSKKVLHLYENCNLSKCKHFNKKQVHDVQLVFLTLECASEQQYKYNTCNKSKYMFIVPLMKKCFISVQQQLKAQLLCSLFNSQKGTGLDCIVHVMLCKSPILSIKSINQASLDYTQATNERDCTSLTGQWQRKRVHRKCGLPANSDANAHLSRRHGCLF